MTNNTTATPLHITEGERDGNWYEFSVNGHGGLIRVVARMEDDEQDYELGRRVRDFLLTSPRAAVLPDVIEAIASQWDECMFAGIGYDIDIGASIRDAYRRLDAAPAAPLAEAVPLTLTLNPNAAPLTYSALGDGVLSGDEYEAQRVAAQAVAADGAQSWHHELKTDPDVFAAVLAGDKTHEIRYNDRGFKVGDTLRLRETRYSGESMKCQPDDYPLEYTGREVTRVISHVLDGYGLMPGWVVLSFASERAAVSPATADSNCTCGMKLGRARHCAALDESMVRYEPFGEKTATADERAAPMSSDIRAYLENLAKAGSEPLNSAVAYKDKASRMHFMVEVRNGARALLARASQAVAREHDDPEIIAASNRGYAAGLRDGKALGACGPLTADAGKPFQSRVQPWMLECFGPTIAADTIERNHRFLEEALELVQSLGCRASEAHQLVDYTFGRPIGEPMQEVGGVMVTLAALCLASELDMHQAGETELARISEPAIVLKIRAKQAAKPKHSPLPVVPADAGEAVVPPKRVEEIMAQAQVFASAWSLVGGRFDQGDALETAEQEKQNLRDLVSGAQGGKGGEA